MIYIVLFQNDVNSHKSAETWLVTMSPDGRVMRAFAIPGSGRDTAGVRTVVRPVCKGFLAV